MIRLKKIIICFLLITTVLLCVTGCQNETEVKQPAKQAPVECVKGIWVSIYDMDFLKENEDIFTQKAEEMFADISSKGFDNVFVQVRAFSDALYKSDIYPFSSYLTGTQGQSPGFDPMDILLKCAHKHSLRFHAWINPYRILLQNDKSKICKDNPAYELMADGNEDVYTCESGIFYNPASIKVQKLILDGIDEIVEKYDVDGIHIDDYFYPVTKEDIDKAQYENYKGNLSLEGWRMMNVNSLVSGIYSRVKSRNKNVIVSVSPSGNIQSNYTTHYADVKRWLRDKGYADWIIPQIYFGFENEYSPFEQTLKEWKNLDRCDDVKLIAGLALYKGGKADENAGRGKNEWINNSDIIKRQIDLCKDSGYVLFSYSYLTNDEFKNCS